ncbi:DoxX family protein [Paenibacillus hunanensis]|uniref:Membrane protein YphA (DoxX/SURF4 family) n=1 Tax=Paenibacillus hunanensis TaxID=539262 RepID=A0ABU1IYP0_9BACL|nr:DoxX family protein [Paenibacillus hunanensis]MDR6244374.1 putative membrane protein YphA (DoxX/SURF4 family) [Paenibacillus hunanensis]
MMKLTVVSTIMRVVLGILFLAHGISKFQMGMDGVAGWFQSVGIPGFLAYVVSPIELVGGILLIIGLFTRYVSILLIIVLLGAVFTVKLSAGLMGNGQMAGYELDLSFMLVALYLAVTNNTGFSLDQMLFRRKTA